jgi:hypothetical protein
MDWHRLDRDKTTIMLNSIKSAVDALMFSPTTSEAKCARLPFYANHLLYRLTNFSSMPIFTMDFIGDGEKYAYLDGSEFPIREINERGGLQLDEENVISYLNFYFYNVRTEDGDILILRNIQEGLSIDLYDDERRENLDIEPDDAQVVFDPHTGTFMVFTPLYYLGGLVAAKITVTRDGVVDVHPLKMMTGGIQQ